MRENKVPLGLAAAGAGLYLVGREDLDVGYRVSRGASLLISGLVRGIVAPIIEAIPNSTWWSGAANPDGSIGAGAAVSRSIHQGTFPLPPRDVYGGHVNPPAEVMEWYGSRLSVLDRMRWLTWATIDPGAANDHARRAWEEHQAAEAAAAEKRRRDQEAAEADARARHGGR